MHFKELPSQAATEPSKALKNHSVINNRGWGGVVEMGEWRGGLGVRLGWGEKAENCT